jgi:hypothetical protein
MIAEGRRESWLALFSSHVSEVHLSIGTGGLPCGKNNVGRVIVRQAQGMDQVHHWTWMRLLERERGGVGGWWGGWVAARAPLAPGGLLLGPCGLKKPVACTTGIYNSIYLYLVFK